MSKPIALSVALTESGVIGYTNDSTRLPWSSDEVNQFRRYYFDKLDAGYLPVVGYKTHQLMSKLTWYRASASLVITRDRRKTIGQELIEATAPVLLLGGRSIFRQFFSLANELVVSQMHYDLKGPEYLTLEPHLTIALLNPNLYHSEVKYELVSAEPRTDYTRRVWKRKPPAPTLRENTWRLVEADIKKRDAEGVERYGVPLTPTTLPDPLWAAYEEALDLVVYLRAEIEKRKHD